MLNLSYYSGSVNGANYQDQDAAITKAQEQLVINVVNRVCDTYSIDEDILFDVMNAHPNEFIGYVMNNNSNVKTDKMIQDLIAESLEEAGYIDEDNTVDEILCALNC